MRLLIISLLIILSCSLIAQTDDSTKFKNQSKELIDESNSSNESKSKFTVIEQMPEYKGGKKKLVQDINAKLDFDKSINGSIIVNFSVASNGKAYGFKSLRGISENIDDQIINILITLQNWTPAQNRRQKIECELNIKIIVEKGKVKNK